MLTTWNTHVFHDTTWNASSNTSLGQGPWERLIIQKVITTEASTWYLMPVTEIVL